MSVVFAPDALADLIAIFDHIARDNRSRATSFVEELRGCAVGLATHPLAWPLVPRYEAKGIRRRVYRGYLIFYVVRASQVLVLRILNGMQDYERLLFPEDAP
jgi:plasmid stabilization system protein ParE